MRIMVEQDRRMTRTVLVTAGIMAAAALPVIAILLLAKFDGGPSQPALEGQPALVTQVVHRVAH